MTHRRSKLLNASGLLIDDRSPLLAVDSNIPTQTANETSKRVVGSLFALNCKGSNTWQSELEGTPQAI
jgi:hypothetical protein